MGKREKKVLIFLIILFILLPFWMARNPPEISSMVIPLWINYYGAVGLWAYWEKPLWQSFLACYGISALGIITIYFGTNIPKIFFSWLKKRLRIKQPPKKLSGRKSKGTNRLTKWLEEESIGLILLFLFLPIPLSGPAATVAMRLKKIKYGLWYLLAVNIPHIFLIVWGVYKGIEFFPSIIEFFKRLFM